MEEPRTLRSKHARLALLEAQGGRCGLCGVQLNPDDWHADHVTPWSLSGRTNVHDMRALCPPCNLRKGASVLRRHQQELNQYCVRLAAGERLPHTIVCDVAPGGGKGSLPLIVAARLIPKVVEKIAVIVPRTALREQAAAAFRHGAVLRAMGLTSPTLEIRESVNDFDPARDKAGFVTTYQALDADSGNTVLRELQRRRYALVLDEPHHCGERGAYARAVRPLVGAAHVCVLSSGTFQRQDMQPISVLPYVTKAGDTLIVDRNDPDHHWINYTLADALHERAIIPLHFEHLDGAATYVTEQGTTETVSSFGDDRQALYTALRTEYATQLLDRCVDDWRGRRQVSPRAALLVVCSNIPQAKVIEAHLKARGITAERATSDDSSEAHEAIRRFKRGAVDCLVTVAMAYEGLDVVRITHIAALTYIRSIPWIMQMFARAWRYDPEAGPWEQQRAVAFVPDDEMMREAVRSLNAVFQEATLHAEPRDDEPADGHGGERSGLVVPLASATTTTTASDGPWGTVVQATAHEQIRAAIRAAGLEGRMTSVDGWRFLEALDHREEAPVVEPVPASPWESMTPGQREAVLRKNASKHIARYERARGIPFGTVNLELRRAGWKAREVMHESELVELLAYVRTTFPLTEQG